MKRFSAGAAVASLALATTVIPAATAKPAAKKSGPAAPAHVYQAELWPVGAVPATGDAQLVDGPKKDKVSIRVRGLDPGVTYSWHIHRSIACFAAPCNPPLEPGWTYKKLKANKAGQARAKGTSKSWAAEAGGTYLVDVHNPSGDVVAQGLFHGDQPPPESYQP